MIRNYALTFAAVLLRVFLGLSLAAMDRGAPVSIAEVYTSSVWGSIFVSSLFAEWFVLRPGGPRAQPRPTPVVAPQGAPS